MVRTVSNGLCKDFYVFPASNYFRFNFSLHFPVHETILPDCYGAANKEWDTFGVLLQTKKVGKGTCELNKHDISLINENILNFHDQQGVTFSTLLKVMQDF